MDQTSEDFQDLAGWAEINKQYAAGQDERNKRRLELLKQENVDLQSKGVEDKSLQGDIKKQESHIQGFGGFPSFNGLDVDVRNVDTEKVVAATQPNTSAATPTVTPAAPVFPSQEELDKINKMDPLQAGYILNDLQKQWRGHQEEMDILTTMKHEKFAEQSVRDIVKEYPILAPFAAGAALATPVYQGLKVIAHYGETPLRRTLGYEGTGPFEYMLRSDKSNPTSPPSMSQLKGGVKGAVVGAGKSIGDLMEGPLKKLLGIED